jgi:hypothetical protein
MAAPIPAPHVVVDGSNIATEGRSIPSLAQLEGAVDELRKEFPDSEITVVVDATFAHRIDESEHERFEQAVRSGNFISPPAGAIGRGDAFLLRIAQKVDGLVLSNDSFQEFHGEHQWLFDRGRLLGATPVPGVGWIFMPRAPVRGPKSRVAVRDTKREHARVIKAIEEATREVSSNGTDETAPKKASGRPKIGATKAASPPRPAKPAREPREVPKPQAVNDPITFITFIAAHPLGEEIEGEVESFTSHGAVVRIGELSGYVPLTNLASPPPRSAREVLGRGERRKFVITALDPYRRGVELSLPGIGIVSGKPSEETVAGELDMTRRHKPPRAKKAAGALLEEAQSTPAPRRAGAAKKATTAEGPKKSAAKKRATKAPATKKAAGAKAPAKKASGRAEKAAPAKKAAAKKVAPPKKAAAGTLPARKRTAAEKAPVAKKAGVKKAAPAKRPAKKAT